MNLSVFCITEIDPIIKDLAIVSLLLDLILNSLNNPNEQINHHILLPSCFLILKLRQLNEKNFKDVHVCNSSIHENELSFS
jgi:hypothetical protein